MKLVQGCTGGDWAVRLQAAEVKGTNEGGDQDPQRASLLFYIADEQVEPLRCDAAMQFSPACSHLACNES